ncbi:CopY/TcrY family copper transport repressor [Desemzia sp. FAM 24101]|uniref:CopY/TcrY family copper transport repressor n=1 Tax=unclassified Desemzia TaxID=2685243 RepID=UPI0038861EC9
MQAMEKITISDAEWEIMRVVWTLKQATSKEINAVLQDKMAWKPATTKTLIGRLVKKGALTTEAMGNRFIYSAAISEEVEIKEATSDILAHICNRKAGEAIAHLLEEAALSHDDMAMLEELLKKKKSEAVDVVACDCVPGQCTCQHFHG